jgi:hypothetical protein
MVGLVLMLGLQLTGVSCLDDWQATVPSLFDKAVYGTGVMAELSGCDGPRDDGCPCHLAFVSVASGSLTVISPVILSEITLPATPPTPRPFTLFRPPLHV